MQIQRPNSPRLNSSLRQPLISNEPVSYFTAATPPPAARMNDENIKKTDTIHPLTQETNFENTRRMQPYYYNTPPSSFNRSSSSEPAGCLAAAIIPCCAGITIGLMITACLA